MHKPWSDWDLITWLNNLENRHSQEIQLGLDRILKVARQLNLQAPESQVVTIAGTNGKGSTVSALEAIYHSAGYSVGSYTSPHLISFNERIRINLTPVPDDRLCQAFSVIEEARGSTVLTYFEMTTLAALWQFKESNLDVIILEVGLGGRLDATNIVDADLAIITTIDYDHQDFLGNTLEAIGYEKAGILRKEKPFIYADKNPPLTIINRARELNVSSFIYGKDYSIVENTVTWNIIFQNHSEEELPKPRIQLKAAAAAILATYLLRDKLPVSHKHRVLAMEKVFIPGRLQLLKGTPNILYDVSHNAQSARLLADTLGSMNIKGRVHAVFSALKDKDISSLIFPLKDCVTYWYPAQLNNKRAASANTLLSIFKDAEISVKICYTNPFIAFETALNQSQAGDLIVVYGSFFTVGQVMAAQHNLLELKEIQ